LSREFIKGNININMQLSLTEH